MYIRTSGHQDPEPFTGELMAEIESGETYSGIKLKGLNS
jgi:hypothetical protein